MGHAEGNCNKAFFRVRILRERRPWLTIISLPLLLCILFVALSWSGRHDIVSRIPLGSKLSDLDQYLPWSAGTSGEVIQWRPAIDSTADGKGQITNELGKFTTVSLGSYDEWKATVQDRDRFTGEIMFFRHSLTSADVNSLVYHEGRLYKKDWGFLPD